MDTPSESVWSRGSDRATLGVIMKDVLNILRCWMCEKPLMDKRKKNLATLSEPSSFWKN